ncbi:hypothetical protein [Aquimarina aggregata]|uniref:hypothetical protein n=1 Tax=Aquimarina aggregata TaxID=1642818 RepID=UPI0024901311|nr:hypothetical protein [Aquimarina aggregata]
MKKQLLFMVLGICYTLTFGQELPQLSPPTPEVAALGKYDDIPMSLSTGTPTISIPLTSISDGALSASVSVSYHASGIKVSEMASRVGLGWALQAGGMISRQVRGIPDDDPEGFINTSNTIAYYYANDTDSNRRKQLFDLAIRGFQDFESDIYHINVAGLSGKFFFDQNGDIVVHQKSDLKIVALRDGQKFSGWEITTPQGVTYTFGVVSGTTQKVTELKETRFHSANTNLPPGGTFHTTGWYLTRINDYMGNQIDFNYTAGTVQINYWNLTGQSKKLLGRGANCTGGTALENTSLTENIYTPTFLSSIVTRSGSIIFDYADNRVDLKNDKALTGVKLINTNNQIIDQYLLDHDYFTAPKGLEFLLNEGDIDQRTKRLYLKTITQQKGTATNKVHRFLYDQTHQLPERFSFSQDLWGYYNGVSNIVLYPSLIYFPYTSPVEVAGADRTVDLSYTKANTLTEIIYPTKGKTSFLFESNTLSGNEDFFLGTKLKDELIPGAQLITDGSQSGTTFTANFTISEVTNAFYQIGVEVPCIGSNNDCPKIQLFKDNVIYNTFATDNLSGVERLNPGSYTIKIENGILQTGNTVDISFTKKTPFNVNDADEAIVGGLRVKEVHFKDYDNTPITTKKYNYQRFDNARVSSGLSLNPPIYLSINVPFEGCNQDMISSNAMFPFNGQGGFHVNYTNVTEYTEGIENGKTEYTYSYAPDGAISATNVFEGEGHLVVPATDYSHRRGQLLQQKVYSYDKIAQRFSVVEESSTGYTPYGVRRTNNIMMGTLGGLNEADSYFNISERYLMTGSTKTNYYPSGTVKTTTSYSYDTGEYLGRTLPLTTTTTDSNGETIETKTYYPDDVTSAAALGETLTTAEYTAISTLKGNGSQPRIGTAIQQETRINNVLVTKQRTNYKDWSGLILPQIVQAAKGNDALEDRIEYLNYDSKGNPLEVQQTNGSHSIYIWGYNELYPIAKIDHATYIGMPAAVTTLINQVKAASNSDTTAATETTLRDLMNQLRDHAYFKDSQLTSFTYDPLVGVTSVTDPRGYAMYYAYDTFNRLEYVRDDEGKLISENKYGYKN